MPDALRTMNAGDVISTKLASVYITIEGQRWLLFQTKNLKATVEKTKTEVPILGRLMKGNKSTGAKGSGSMTIYDNTPIFTDLMLDYIRTGEDTYFDLQVVNHDPTSKAGMRVVMLIGCNFDKLPITSADADGEYLETDIDFTFEDVKIPQNFSILDGMTI